jgi:hypothetical protein
MDVNQVDRTGESMSYGMEHKMMQFLDGNGNDNS